MKVLGDPVPVLQNRQPLLIGPSVGQLQRDRAVMAGASGYLLKQIRGSSLVDGIRQVAAGRSLLDPAMTKSLLDRLSEPLREDSAARSLTARERDILDLIAEGCTNREIGQRLFLAEKTVKNYVSSLLAKLGMQRRTQAAVYGSTLRKGISGSDWIMRPADLSARRTRAPACRPGARSPGSWPRGPARPLCLLPR